MNAVFADTFYWIALADSTDSSHRQALALPPSGQLRASFTTDEVLTEYLTLFATAPEHFGAERRKALSASWRVP